MSNNKAIFLVAEYLTQIKTIVGIKPLKACERKIRAAEQSVIEQKTAKGREKLSAFLLFFNSGLTEIKTTLKGKGPNRFFCEGPLDATIIYGQQNKKNVGLSANVYSTIFLSVSLLNIPFHSCLPCNS